jgi:hypothetical protein
MRWSDADIVFQMEAIAGLNNANVPAAVVPVPVPVPVPGDVVPVPFVPTPLLDLVAGRLFRAWIEDNNEWLDMDTNHVLAKGRLLHKYKGMHFKDENRDLNIVTGLEFSGGRTKLGWTLVCENQSDRDVVPLLINEVIDLIGICVQPPELNVETIVDEPKQTDNILQLVAIEAEKRAKVEEKKKQAITRRLANAD